MSNIEKIVSLLKEANEKQVLVKDIDVFGYQFNYNTKVLGSVSKYWFGKHEVIEYIAPKNSESSNSNRPATKKTSTEYIVVHDTASSAEHAGALSHAKYVYNGGGGTSWHYSSGSDGIYHQIPDDEVAYHAGDALVVPFSLTNTLVKGNTKDPSVEIKNGYYYINGEKSSIKAPKVTFIKGSDNELHYASDGFIQGKKAPVASKENEEYLGDNVSRINEQGVRIDLKDDGYYYMGPTYYSSGYGYISNRGGNLHSIGIETMINQGSDLYLTWQKTAKLVAHLLKDNNLDLSKVKQHHFFSGKDCPMTLRHANLWDNFMKMVKYEYEILLLSENIEISFKCDSEYVDETGRIVSLPSEKTLIKYFVKVKDTKTSEEYNIELETYLGE